MAKAARGASATSANGNAYEQGKGILSGGEKPGKGASAKMECCEITVRRGHAGGFIVKNRMEDKNGGGATHEYPLGKLSQVIKHIRQHLAADEPEAAETTVDKADKKQDA